MGAVLLSLHFHQHTALSASSSVILALLNVPCARNGSKEGSRWCGKKKMQESSDSRGAVCWSQVWSQRAPWGEPLYTNSGRIVRFFSLLWHTVVDLSSYLTALLFAAGSSYRLDRYRLCLMWYWDPACIPWWHSAKGLNVPHAGLRS